MVTSLHRATTVTLGLGAATLAVGPTALASPTYPDGGPHQVASASAAAATSAPATVWTLWTARVGMTARKTASSSGIVVGYPSLGLKLTAVLGSGRNAGWALVTSGTYAGRWVYAGNVTTTDPAHPLATVVATDPVTTTRGVTRYVVAGTAKPNIRASNSYRSTVITTTEQGAAFVGYYTDQAWFHITSGAYAGRYISGALLQRTPTLSSYNGHLRSAGLCPIDAFMNTKWEPTTARYLACPARDALRQMNTAFKAQFGYNLGIDEGYRSLVKQRFFYQLLGPAIAAVPGTSSHGLGAAIDFDTIKLPGHTRSIYYWGTPQDKWLTANAENWGFERPSWYSKPGTNSEYWHYNFVG